ncbi:Similar to Transposon TX1 uncharacterized 82 kDa protein (Xenopus laevis) [Cotesia congregata]|uniref:Similar to Transposon TX1 uncharacterized 82 kDa protein (Xenopus laevis) n=1 Tax=Cotesia congregata TaxID=51543 RepID=A0A8J2H6C1_COTCN|nr:Similar to Transposon TX1 uncharacterized 82 kDa protein (Xenopus laevis) [Cotesia congregata]
MANPQIPQISLIQSSLNSQSTQGFQNSQKAQSPENSQSTQSYLNIAQADCFPKKEQAIVIDISDDSQLKEYTQALARVIPPSQIRFISRIANNRICAYLATKEIANELVDKHKVIMVRGHTVPIRPLIIRNKRIILSNVCPVIPHYVLVDKLKELNITPTSPVSFLRAGLTEPGFSYILSFRRQLYVTPDDISKIPDRLQITFEETSYWIYINTDTMSCFLCKNEGHIAKNCPNVNEKDIKEKLPANTESSTTQMPPPSIPVSNPPSLIVNLGDLINIEDQNLKRPHPASSTSSMTQVDLQNPGNSWDEELLIQTPGPVS